MYTNTGGDEEMWQHLRAHSKESEVVADAIKVHDEETNPPWLDNVSEKSDDAEKVESEKIESASMVEIDGKIDADDVVDKTFA
jgi:hypothetical protein